MSKLSSSICQLLTKGVLEELRRQEVRTVVDFVQASLEELAQKCSLSYKDLIAVRRLILAKYSSFPVTASALYNDIISSTAVLSTGCKGLDTLLEGGFYTGEITELVGQSSSGKSQICIGTAILVAFTTSQNVLYIDTSGSLCPQTIESKLVNCGVTQQVNINSSQLEVLEMRTQRYSVKKIQDCCSRIRCVGLFDVFELLEYLHHVAEAMNSQTDEFSNLKLIVIDSIAAVLSPLIGGQQSDGHLYMAHVATQLKLLATQCSLAVVVVNNTVSSGDGDLKPALGRSWHPVPNTRVLVQAKESGQRKATVIKSCKQACGPSVVFDLSELELNHELMQNQSF